MPERKPVRTFFDIPGWFRWLDKVLFDTLLEAQDTGDLVELGVYLGKSAVVLGSHVRVGERLVVVDLFGTDPGDHQVSSPGRTSNLAENQRSYGALEREAFEANYLALHPELPVIITGPSSSVTAHVPPGTVRFLHVDAGHLYDNAREDVANSKVLLAPEGVVVFDDYRTEHTPGVAAAVWEAVVNHGLRPFALTPNKFYGTYGDPAPYRELVERFLAADDRFKYEEQEILGHRVLRARLSSQPRPGQGGVTLAELKSVADDIVQRVTSHQPGPAAPPARHDAPTTPVRTENPAARPAGRARPRPTTRGAKARAVAKDVLPPVVTRTVRRLRG